MVKRHLHTIDKKRLTKKILKRKYFFIEILLVLYIFFSVIKLNVLCKLKKKAKMLKMTTFKMNTNIRFFQ